MGKEKGDKTGELCGARVENSVVKKKQQEKAKSKKNKICTKSKGTGCNMTVQKMAYERKRERRSGIIC